jgi:hypothetical protein
MNSGTYFGDLLTAELSYPTDYGAD